MPWIEVGSTDIYYQQEAEYHAIRGAPHNVYYEAAAPYNAIVDAFLAKVAAPAGVC